VFANFSCSLAFRISRPVCASIDPQLLGKPIWFSAKQANADLAHAVQLRQSPFETTRRFAQLA
jgi:hypothetical protein